MTRELVSVVEDVTFPEGLRWHDGALWYADIGRAQVSRVVPGGNPEVVARGIPHASGLGWTQDGVMLVTSISASTLFRVGADGKPVPWCGPNEHDTAWTNDMVTSGSRSYISCGGRSYEPGADEEIHNSDPVGRVVLVDHETGICRTAADTLAMPNGAAITPDGRTFIVAESYGGKISAFDIREDGTLANRRLFAEVAGTPDGLTLDAELAVWVGTGENFQRINASGKLIETIAVPGWRAIACMLGGEDDRSLFMALGQFDDVEEIFAGTARGRIMMTKVEVPVGMAAGTD